MFHIKPYKCRAMKDFLFFFLLFQLARRSHPYVTNERFNFIKNDWKVSRWCYNGRQRQANLEVSKLVHLDNLLTQKCGTFALQTSLY